jgi:hypothetical protein
MLRARKKGDGKSVLTGKRTKGFLLLLLINVGRTGEKKNIVGQLTR